MKSSYNNQFSKIIKKIYKETRSLKKTQLNYNFLINELIYLNLKVENILFDRSRFQKNPTPIVKFELQNLYSKIVSIKKFKDFDKNILTPKYTWIREKITRLFFKNSGQIFH